MYLYGIEPCFYSELDSLSICICHLIDLLHVHLLHEGRGVEVEASARSVRHASADAPVGHVAAMSELYRDLCAFGVDRVRQLLQLGHDLLAHP